jgi:cytidylate kinase
MDTKIIGLAGPAGVGKSFLAMKLKGITHGELFSFAANIRMGLYIMGLSINYEDKRAPVYNGKSTRDLMKSLGTEWGREKVGQDIWVDLLMARIDQCDSHSAVIDDVRFPNEAQAIRKRGGVVIELSRDGINYDGSHASEEGLDPSDIDLKLDCTDTKEAINTILQLQS